MNQEQLPQSEEQALRNKFPVGQTVELNWDILSDILFYTGNNAKEELEKIVNFRSFKAEVIGYRQNLILVKIVQIQEEKKLIVVEEWSIDPESDLANKQTGSKFFK